IQIARTYNSSDLRKGPFGTGWVFSYDQRLIETTDGMQVYAICSQSNGKLERFIKKPDGSYTPPAHVRASLVKNSDNTYTLRDNTLMRITYDSSGRVSTHVDGGETWTYTYQPSQKRTTKRDSQGNTWTYDYNDTGNVTKRTDPFGSTELYKFDDKLNITEFTD